MWSARMAMCWGVGGAAAISTACFDDASPAGAVLLCADDDDCPAALVCSLARHVCVEAGADAVGPTVREVSFDPPALAGGTAELVIVADEALADAPPPEVVFAAGSGPLALTPLGAADTRWTFLIDADGALEGVYPVERVTITDQAGNPAEARPLDVALRIDRTAPELFDLVEVDPPSSGFYSDVDAPGTSATLSMRVRANEPLDLEATTLRLGAERSAPGGCALDAAAGSLSYRCSVAVTAAGLIDGDNDAAIDAADAAGNGATSARAVQADVRAPAIVLGSTTLAIDSSGFTTPVAGLNSQVRFGFVASEDLAGTPQASLMVGTNALPFTLDVAVGRRYEMTLFIAAPVPAGSWPIEVSLTDAFGHTATALPATLPAPFLEGVPFVDGGGAVCPTPAAVACVDFDGDGAPASAACANGGDLDDTDPLVHPGAYDVPGDGRDNDLVGGDAPLDDSAGLFVDADAGSDAGAGTRASPIQSLGEALARVQGGAPDVLFLARAAAPYAIGELGVDVIVGGLDPLTWQRTGVVSQVFVGGWVYLGRYAEGVRIEGAAAVNLYGTTAARVIVADATTRIEAASLLHDVQLFTLEVLPAGAGTRLLSSEVTATTQVRGALTVDRSELFDEVAVEDAFGRLLATNSRFDSFASPVDCYGCAHVELHHCTLLSRSSGDALWLGSAGATARISNSILVSFASSAVGVDGMAEVVLDHNALFCAYEVAMVNGSYLSIEQLNAWPAPIVATGNLSLDPQLDLATLLLSPGSPLVGAAGDALAAGAPTTVLADVEGDCRYDDGEPDIGMDEAD